MSGELLLSFDCAAASGWCNNFSRLRTGDSRSLTLFNGKALHLAVCCSRSRYSALRKWFFQWLDGTSGDFELGRFISLIYVCRNHHGGSRSDIYKTESRRDKQVPEAAAGA